MAKRKTPSRRVKRKNESESPERTLRKEGLAAELGIHPNTALQWAKAGCPHSRKSREPYRFNANEVRAWLDQHNKTGRPGRPPTIEAKSLQQAKLALTIEQAQLTRLRRQHEEDKLHDVAECKQRRLRQIQAVKSSLLALPRSVASRLVGRARPEIESILATELERVLSSFAEGAA